jgi:[acyl-carrier-protein] S-malonyltransferase
MAHLHKNAFIFPGQGAQRPLMGKDFYDSFLEAKEVFQEADDLLSLALSKIIFDGPMEKLTETIYSQPAIFVTSAAILAVMRKQFPDLKPQMTGGLSLGEYTALYAALKLDFASCLKLVAARGKYMQEACEKYPGAMLVVMGLEESEIAKTHGWIANVNCPGQIVVACSKENVESITSELIDRGAKKIIPIPVSGAFHSPLMKSAKESLMPLIDEMNFQKSDILLAMNVAGNFVENIAEIKTSLIEQVASPTRWMKCVQAMMEKEASHFYEIGPSQLVAMNRKIGVTAQTISVEKISDLERIHAAIG